MPRPDDFSPKTIRALQMRAAFICSNPKCRCLTIAPSDNNDTDCLYIGHASHITAASEGGPRYNPILTSEERKDISNAIYLCASCATMVDKNKGADFSVAQLENWKNDHESWVRENHNKNPEAITEVAGTHEARGIGDVTGLHISKAAKIKPGTIAKAAGIGKITGTSIE